MKNIKIIILVAAVAFLASCSVTVPYMATNNPIGKKVGISKTTSLFGTAFTAGTRGSIEGIGITFNSKYGIAEAADNGGIKKISTVDVKKKTILFVHFYELIVTGN